MPMVEFLAWVLGSGGAGIIAGMDRAGAAVSDARTDEAALQVVRAWN